MPTADISTPSSPHNNLYTCLHPTVSTAHQWAAPATVTFPQAPIAQLHLPSSSSAVPLLPSPKVYSSFCTWPFGLCMSHRNKNHSRDTSNVCFHVSSFLYLGHSDGLEFGAGSTPVGTFYASILHHSTPGLAKTSYTNIIINTIYY